MERREVKIQSTIVQVMAYSMEGFFKSSVELYVELFPSAPSVTAASSVRIATPCTPETHEHAPAATPTTNGGDTIQGGVDPTDAEDMGGADPAGSTAKSFHTADARVIMKAMHAA